ncbi:hypothetical protein [Bradyrhizobium sp. BWA-3-5]|uniref:hypothetical protein n=1 Tax=Bradyrhizobium sp. BWA-3-5 TaxID=3080013 RepID=UPI00293E930A|nr:hypothetical protein [Bradyrhizobium sp. BWA-3-5]WOH64025.1 hypothetical protein RX331_25830 [Bradyrhizobium sp. BWA-3-5]
MKSARRAVMSVGAFLAIGMQAGVAQVEPEYDVRDITVGRPVSIISDAGYANLSCARDPKAKLPAWSVWDECPAEPDAVRAIHFEFDRETSQEGTIIAGHPVLLTVFIDGKGIVSGLDIETDPNARLYARKKAFLLAAQVRSHYGSEGWTCTEGKAEAEEQPVGGVFIRETCRKALPDRFLTVERNLFRRAGRDVRDFVDRTHVRITRQMQ